MAAKKPPQRSEPPSAGRAKPAARSGSTRPDEDLDAGWFDDDAEAPTIAKKSDAPARRSAPPKKTASTPPRKTPSAAPAKSPPRVEPKSAAKGAAPKTAPAKTPPADPRDRGASNAARLLPPTRRATIEVQVDWLEEEPRTTAKTIPVEADWLEFGEEEPTTIAKPSRSGPPPIPKPPPLPKVSEPESGPRAKGKTGSKPPPAHKR